MLDNPILVETHVITSFRSVQWAFWKAQRPKTKLFWTGEAVRARRSTNLRGFEDLLFEKPNALKGIRTSGYSGVLFRRGQYVSASTRRLKEARTFEWREFSWHCCGMVLKAKGVTDCHAMKPAGLALLILARLIEVGVRQFPKVQPGEISGPVVNQTCLCQCECSYTGTSVEGLSFSLGAASGISVFLFWKLVCWASPQIRHEPSPSPRRRGGGVVSMPSWADRDCVVQWWQCLPWEGLCVESK